MSLSNKALLVYLGISQWSGRKHDRKATNSVKTQYLTSENAGNYTKKLLPGAKALAKVSTLAGSIRIFFYAQTLPWMSDGSRIISSKNYLQFIRDFQAKKLEFDKAVCEFLIEYPQLRQDAKISLGDLFSESEYPSESSLANKFDCQVSFMPLPHVNDFRTEVLDSEKTEFINKMKEVEHRAMQECWSRLHEVVSRAAERLASPDAIFRDSLLENISDICALLPRLNVIDDPNLELARQSVESIVKGLSANQCREDAKARQDAASKLNEMIDKMGAFMGAGNGN